MAEQIREEVSFFVGDRQTDRPLLLYINHHHHHELTVCVSYPLSPPTSLPSSLHCVPGGPSCHEPDHDDDIDYKMMMMMITWATEARNSWTAATSLADKRESRSREWKRSTFQLKWVQGACRCLWNEEQTSAKMEKITPSMELGLYTC